MVNVLIRALVSGSTDTTDAQAATCFTSPTYVPLIEAAHIVSLPQATDAS